MVGHTSIFSAEKYLLRNISVGGVVVWDNSDKVWCNILEIKRMRSQGSHHHPALNKERRRQYGLCSQGDYSIDPRIYLPIEVCSTISFQSREDLIYFHYWPKLWGFPRLRSRALLSRVDSRYFAWNTWEPLICHLLCSHVENFWDIWRSRFFYAFWIQIWFSRPEGGRVLQLFAWLNLIWFGSTADMKGTEFESVIFLKHKGSVTKYVEVSLDFQQLNKTYYL